MKTGNVSGVNSAGSFGATQISACRVTCSGSAPLGSSA